MVDATVVVTGADEALGAAVATACVERGAHVVAGASDAGALGEAVEGFRRAGADAGGTATGVRTDVRDEFDLERLVETAARTGDGIDAVVACAAVVHGDPGDRPIHEASYAAFDDTIRTNVRGTFATLREAVPHLAPRARLLVPSVPIADDGPVGTGPYGVARAGLEAVARAFAADLDHPVGIVDPGLLETGTGDETGRPPSAVAPMFAWAAFDADPALVDGEVVDRRAWRQATE